MPHIHEKYDFTINAFIVFEGKVLLVNHPRYKLWLAPGGHVELNEDPEQTLFREIKEETGYSISEVTILSSKPEQLETKARFLYTPNFLNVHEANPPHRHITLIYFAKATHGNHVISGEHSDAKWFSLEDLDIPDYNIPPGTRFCAQEAIKIAGNT